MLASGDALGWLVGGALVFVVLALFIKGFNVIADGIAEGLSTPREKSPPGTIENLIAGTRAKARAYRDRAEVEEFAAAAQRELLRQSLETGAEQPSERRHD